MTTASTAYRSFIEPETDAYRDPFVRERANLVGLRAAVDDARARARAVSRALGGQLARIAFGVVGIATTVVLVGTMLEEWAASSRLGRDTEVLVVGFLAAIGASLLVRVGAAFVLRPRSPVISGALERDIAAFEAELRRRERRRALATPALMRASLTLPAIAVALNAPLLLHLPAAAFLELMTRHTALHSFDIWMKVSFVVVGHAHLVLAWLAYRHAQRIAAMTEGELAADKDLGLAALGWTTLTAAIPGVILLSLPPLITFATGVFFIPVLWGGLRRLARRDRRLLRGAAIA